MWLVTSALEMTEGLLGPNALASIQQIGAEGEIGEMKGGFGWRRIKELRDAEVARQQECVLSYFYLAFAPCSCLEMKLMVCLD